MAQKTECRICKTVHSFHTELISMNQRVYESEKDGARGRAEHCC